MPVDPIPQGYHTVTPYLFLKDARAFIDFAGRAFGARASKSAWRMRQARCGMPRSR